MFDLSQLDTGDILLFSAQWSWNPINWFARAVEYFTSSPYSHIGIVMRDPVCIDSDLKGLYLWESTYQGTPDPQDGNIKLGVQMTPMKQIMKLITYSILAAIGMVAYAQEDPNENDIVKALTAIQEDTIEIRQGVNELQGVPELQLDLAKYASGLEIKL